MLFIVNCGKQQSLKSIEGLKRDASDVFFSIKILHQPLVGFETALIAAFMTHVSSLCLGKLCCLSKRHIVSFCLSCLIN